VQEHHGGCHCGNVRWTLRSRLGPSELPVRACQCGFCRKHGVLSTSDPQGEMHFAVRDCDAMVNYQFGTKTADFLIYQQCGVYVGAQMREGNRYYAITNLNTSDFAGNYAQRAEPMNYSGGGRAFAPHQACESVDAGWHTGVRFHLVASASISEL
jgi:hypothetical protein